jgi:subtilisin family serine protease
MLIAPLILVTSNAPAVLDSPEGVPAEIVEEARNSYLFVLHDSVPRTAVRGLARRLTRGAEGQLRHTFSRAIKGFSATISEQGAMRLAQNPNVAFYEPNGIVWAADPAYRGRVGPQADHDGHIYAPPTTPPRPGQDPDDEPPEVMPWGVTRVGGPVDGTGRHAWVIDSGIDLDHPDLNVGYGANFVLSGPDIGPDDANGHGTHVAGTIGAIDNDIDVVGVAANATVHPVRVLAPSGFGTTDAIVAGIDFVAANALPGDAANMSLGGEGHLESVHLAVERAASLGIRFAIAAGNNSADAADYEPAHVDHENVYTVSAIDENDVFATFSNYGNPPIDFAAPGVEILSTQMDGGVTIKSGTSMAAPHVCGILLFQAPNVDGYAIDDPDGEADPIAHF